MRFFAALCKKKIVSGQVWMHIFCCSSWWSQLSRRGDGTRRVAGTGLGFYRRRGLTLQPPASLQPPRNPGKLFTQNRVQEYRIGGDVSPFWLSLCRLSWGDRKGMRNQNDLDQIWLFSFFLDDSMEVGFSVLVPWTRWTSWVQLRPRTLGWLGCN